MSNNERYFPVQARKDQVIIRSGKLVGAAAADQTVESNKFSSLIKSATRNSAGNFSLTFDKKYPELRDFNAKVIGGTTAYLRAEFTALDVTAGTATLQYDVNGVATDPGTSDVTYIELTVRNSGRNK